MNPDDHRRDLLLAAYREGAAGTHSPEQGRLMIIS